VSALRLAHRGDWRVAPENTLAAMAAALSLPHCDGLEFDVRGSSDGVPVLLHDATLERVQGLAVDVASLTAEELAAHGVPTLAAMLAAAGPGPFLDVELKGRPVAAVIGVLEAARGLGLERTVVSSFEPEALAFVARARPAWPLWGNAMDLAPATIDLARQLGCSGLSVQWSSIDEDGMARAAGAGLQVAAWTVRDVATYRRLEVLGVTAICAEAEALDG